MKLLNLLLFLIIISSGFSLGSFSWDRYPPTLSELRHLLAGVRDNAIFLKFDPLGRFNTLFYKYPNRDLRTLAERVLRLALKDDPYFSITYTLPRSGINKSENYELSLLNTFPESLGIIGYEISSANEGIKKYQVLEVAYGSWAWYSGAEPGDILELRDHRLILKRSHRIIAEADLEIARSWSPPAELDFEYSLTSGKIKGVSYLIVRIREFRPGLYYRIFRMYRDKFKSFDPEVVIFDLRGSPGGSFWEAFFFTCSYRPEGSYSVTLATRKKIRDLYCYGSPLKFQNKLIAVFQDRDTISAPEVISLTAKASGLVIGQRSGGKPWLQVRQRGDGLEVQYTIGFVSDLKVLKPHDPIAPDIFASSEEDFNKALKGLAEIVRLLNLAKVLW